MQKMIPHLWFDQTAEEAVQFYVHLFPRAIIKGLTHSARKGSRSTATLPAAAATERPNADADPILHAVARGFVQSGDVGPVGAGKLRNLAMQTLASALIWLLVIFLGITVGAGLYEARVVVPVWSTTPPETWINTGTAFWALVSTGPLTLIVLVSLIAVWWFDGPARAWWLGALGVMLIERIVTFTYFIPTMIWLQQQGGMSPEVSSTLATWSFINHGRHILTISAWLLSIKALSLLSTARHASGDL